MPYNAKSGTLAIGKKTMDYIVFGEGERALVMLPGLSDGLRSVKGSEQPFALMYRAYAKSFRVYVFSRVNELSEGSSTRDMAADVKSAMDALGLERASVFGVSMGGMIAQHLALDYPESVDKLVLAVTLARPNDTVREAIGAWTMLAKKDDYKRLMADTAERSYSEVFLRSHRLMLPLLSLTGKPASFTRFLIQAQACITHNAYERLPELDCPVLVLGGGCDRVVGADAAEELSARIAGSRLHIYEGLGHAAYEEAKDFNQRVLDFLA